MTAVRLYRFYLVRHGKAEPGNAGGDSARRLTPEGRASFAAHAKAIAGRMELQRIATSPLARARETAGLLGAVTGASVEEEEALVSGASSAPELLALGRKLGAGVALVGHNPEVAEAIALAAGRQLEVRPGAVAEVEVDGEELRLAWLEAP